MQEISEKIKDGNIKKKCFLCCFFKLQNVFNMVVEVLWTNAKMEV